MSTYTVCQGHGLSPIPRAPVQGQLGRLLQAALRWTCKFLPVIVFLGPLPFLLDHAASQPRLGPVSGSFTHENRTTLYRYDASPFIVRGAGKAGNVAPQPGLLVFLHGNNTGSQQDMIDSYFSPWFKRLAWNHGLIPVVLASHGTKLFDLERRHWDYQDDISMLEWLLWRGFDGEFNFDPNRVVFYGASQGSGFLFEMFRRIAEGRVPSGSFITHLSGGAILHCGGFLGSSAGVPNHPQEVTERFRLFVQATTEDYAYERTVRSASYMRDSGWDVFGDFSNSGDHCAPGMYSIDAAIGWILGTTRYTLRDGAGERLGLMSRLFLSDSPGTTSESVDVRQGADGKWRIDGQIVESGYELVRDGRKFTLEFADDESWNPAWRIAEYSISSIAGIGPRPDDTTESASSPLGDGGMAAEAQLWDPLGVAVDAEGVVYFSDEKNHRIRKIDAAGIITTVAGTGAAGYGGDGGPATQATLNLPSGVAVDIAGNVYFADTSNHRIRKIDAAGVITTVAGTGAAGYGGDGGPATQATLQLPSGMAVDVAGNVYFADTLNHRIRKIDTAGVITTVAGTGVAGYGGDGGLATQATLSFPSGVAVDANGYRLFFADTGNYRIRSVYLGGDIRTAAITPISTARFVGVALDWFNNLYFTSYNTIIKRRADYRTVFSLSKRGSFSVVAGRFAGDSDTEGGLAGGARFGSGFIAVTDFGRIVIPDELNDRIRVLEPLQDVTATRLNLTREALSTMHFFDSGNFAKIISGSTIQAGTRLRLDVKLDHSAPVSLAGSLDLSFLPEDDSATSVPQFSSGSRQAQFLVPAGTTSALFANQSPVLDLLSGETGGRLSISLRIATTTGKIDLTAVSAPILHLDIEEAGEQRDVATGISLSVNPRTVSESNGSTAVRVTATLVGGLRNSDTVVNVTVTGSGTEEAVDFAPVPSFLVTIAAGNVEGTGTFALTPENDTADEKNETLTISGTALVPTLRVTGSRLTLQDDDPRDYDSDMYFIRTVAGHTNVADAIPATSASLNRPSDVAVDDDGNVYVADSENDRVRMIDPSGIISTFAGTGNWGHGGDGGPATDAALNAPSSVAVDAAGSLYVSDRQNHRVRMVNAAGIITTVAGTGRQGFGGDGGPASEALLSFPGGIAVDASGNLHIADTGNQRVRTVNVRGIISTVAGTGDWEHGGDGGPATEAGLRIPTAIATDSVGNMFVTTAARVRKIDATGIITTYAGTGERGFNGDGGPASEAQLNYPIRVTADAIGNVYVADSNGRRVRKIDPSGIITTLAGTGESDDGEDGGLATETPLEGPNGVALDPHGNVFVSDAFANKIRKIDATGIIRTYAGTGDWKDPEDTTESSSARFRFPKGAALDPSGNFYFSDDARVWKLDAAGTVTVFAGTGTRKRLLGPWGLATDAFGNVYVADRWWHRVFKIDARGNISTLAGTGRRGFGGDGGPATEAQLSGPTSVAVDPFGNVYVADERNHRIRMIDSDGNMSTFAGTGERGGGGDGGPANQAEFSFPNSVAADSSGNIYVAEERAGRVRRIDPSGDITLITDAVLGQALAVDVLGDLYVGSSDFRIVRISGADGDVSVIAGTGEPGFAGDGGLAENARLSAWGIAVDADGRVWFTDAESRRVRVLERSAPR